MTKTRTGPGAAICDCLPGEHKLAEFVKLDGATILECVYCGGVPDDTNVTFLRVPFKQPVSDDTPLLEPA